MTQRITSSHDTANRPEKDDNPMQQIKGERPHILMRREARRVRRIR